MKLGENRLGYDRWRSVECGASWSIRLGEDRSEVETATFEINRVILQIMACFAEFNTNSFPPSNILTRPNNSCTEAQWVYILAYWKVVD